MSIGCSEPASEAPPSDSGGASDTFQDSLLPDTAAVADSAAVPDTAVVDSIVDSGPSGLESGAVDAAFDAAPLPVVAPCPVVTPIAGKVADGTWVLHGTTDGAAIVQHPTTRVIEAISLTTGARTKIADELVSAGVRVDERAALVANSTALYGYRACDGVHTIGKSPRVLGDSGTVAGITSPNGTSVLYVDTKITPTLTLATMDGTARKELDFADENCFAPTAVGDRWLSSGCLSKFRTLSISMATGAAFELVPGALRVLDTNPAQTLVETATASYRVPTSGGVALPFELSAAAASLADGEVVFVNTKGELRRTKGTSALATGVKAMRLLPDGKHVIFAKTYSLGRADLWVLTLETGAIRNVTMSDQVMFGAVAITEDGKHLVWTDDGSTESGKLKSTRLADFSTVPLANSMAFVVVRNTVIFGVVLPSPMFASKLYALDLAAGSGTATVIANEAIGFCAVHPSRKHIVSVSSSELRVADIP